MIAVPTTRGFDRVRVAQLADWLAVAVAVSLPWSTSASAILIALWLVAVVPTLDIEMLRRELASAAGGLPVLLWLLAAVGMLWADVSWSERLYGLGGFHRLLVIPLLLAQFRRSEHGPFVLYGFLVSATCLLATSWAFAFVPALAPHGKAYGVPVKDYILQSGIFLICAFALIGAAFEAWRAHNLRLAVAVIALAVIFLGNIAFVVTSRTVLVVAPVLIIVLGWRLFSAKGVVAACLVTAALAAALWVTSSYLRERTLDSIKDLRTYYTANKVNSTGLHFEFLKKSVSIIEEAPIVGHGTGSIAEQFRLAAAGESGAAGTLTVNAHNQIFAVAIELGILGAVVLLAMWAAHLMLFRGAGLAAWIGTIVVLQNVVSSLFNSHLFDFSQGWLYVFGVGVAGGMMLRERDCGPAAAVTARP